MQRYLWFVHKERVRLLVLHEHGEQYDEHLLLPENERFINGIGVQAYRMMYEGKLPPITEATSLGDVICGTKTGRTDDDERICFIASGMPVWDVGWGYDIYENAKKLGVTPDPKLEKEYAKLLNERTELIDFMSGAALEAEKPDVKLLVNAAGYGKFGAWDRISLEVHMGRLAAPGGPAQGHCPGPLQTFQKILILFPQLGLHSL